MSDLAGLLPAAWALTAGEAPGPPVPPDLIVQARRLALEDWGESMGDKRNHFERLMRAELQLRAPHAFGLDPARVELSRHRNMLLMSSSVEAPTRPAARWRRVLNDSVNLVRAIVRHRLAVRVADGDIRARLAAVWSERCFTCLMATYDLEFIRGQQVAARTNHQAAPIARTEGAQI